MIFTVPAVRYDRLSRGGRCQGAWRLPKFPLRNLPCCQTAGELESFRTSRALNQPARDSGFRGPAECRGGGPVCSVMRTVTGRAAPPGARPGGISGTERAPRSSVRGGPGWQWVKSLARCIINGDTVYITVPEIEQALIIPRTPVLPVRSSFPWHAM
eukprot:417924-Hanusia_phi.AAC.1